MVSGKWEVGSGKWEVASGKENKVKVRGSQKGWHGQKTGYPSGRRPAPCGFSVIDNGLGQLQCWKNFRLRGWKIVLAIIF